MRESYLPPGQYGNVTGFAGFSAWQPHRATLSLQLTPREMSQQSSATRSRRSKKFSCGGGTWTNCLGEAERAVNPTAAIVSAGPWRQGRLGGKSFFAKLAASSRCRVLLCFSAPLPELVLLSVKVRDRN